MEEKVILGEGCVYSSDSKKTGLNNNIIVCGGSGSGKTMSISEPRLLSTTTSSLIATVTKKRLVHKYAPLFNERGYTVEDLDFADPNRSDAGFDPLSQIETTQDITFLARSIVMADPGKENSDSDPYWDDSASALLSAEIAYTMFVNENATFADVLKMHDGLDLRVKSSGSESIVTAYDEDFEALSDAKKKKPVPEPEAEDIKEAFRECYSILKDSGEAVEEIWDVACSCARDKAKKRAENEQRRIKKSRKLDEKKDAFARFALSNWNSFRKVPRITASCIFGTLNACLDNLFSPEVRKIFSAKRQVDFKALASKKTVLFVTTDPVNTSLGFLINMFYSYAIKQLFEYAEELPGGVLPVPVHIICDDFATGGKILDFPEYISVFREKGISVTLLLQSESQLDSMYGADNAVTVINNCDTYIYMGGMDLNTARNVSLRLNVPMSDVLCLEIGKEIIFRRGQRPVVTSRYNIADDELYRQVSERYEKTLKNKGRY